MNLKSRVLASSLALASAGALAAVDCADSGVTTGNAGYLGCQGSFSGNLAPGQTNAATFSGYGTFSLVGKSDDTGLGPFASSSGAGTSGTLSFDTPQAGLFVLGIKGGPTYSLYLFDGGSLGVSALNFDTLGVAKGNGSAGPGLSHLALFTQPVPEPGSYALMFAGLAVVGSIVHRRRLV